MLAAGQDVQGQPVGEAQLPHSLSGVRAEGEEVHGGGGGPLQLQILLVLHGALQRVPASGGQVLLPALGEAANTRDQFADAGQSRRTMQWNEWMTRDTGCRVPSGDADIR